MLKKLRVRDILWMILTLILLFYIVVDAYDHKDKRDLYLNHTYFELTDVSQAIEKQPTGDPTAAAKLHDSLVRLDQLFTNQMFGRLYTIHSYFPNFFIGIESGKYSDAERLEMAQDIREILKALSDETGINSDDTFTYREIDDIFAPFFHKWIR